MSEAAIREARHKAEIILKDNKSYLGSDISDAAIAELEKDKEENHEVSKKKTKTRNKSAN